MFRKSTTFGRQALVHAPAVTGFVSVLPQLLSHCSKKKPAPEGSGQVV
jgi:hypothetical protein